MAPQFLRMVMARIPRSKSRTVPLSSGAGCCWTKVVISGEVGEYGPFYYTKDDIREVLAYAKARHVRVIPEIEIPGHSREVILCHPGFTCLDWGAFADMIRERERVDQAAALCVGNDEVMKFFENVFDEVCELFPDEYVHIGGDECPRRNWKNCPKCQKRMKDEGLKSEDELQKWVTHRFSKYLAKKGRRIIGWDEILVGGLPEGATVMSWRGAEGGVGFFSCGRRGGLMAQGEFD